MMILMMIRVCSKKMFMRSMSMWSGLHRTMGNHIEVVRVHASEESKMKYPIPRSYRYTFIETLIR